MPMLRAAPRCSSSLLCCRACYAPLAACRRRRELRCRHCAPAMRRWRLQRADRALAATPRDASDALHCAASILAEMQPRRRSDRRVPALIAGLSRARRAVQQPGGAARARAATPTRRALRSKPRCATTRSYAIAHENLGDIYATLAARAWARAAELDPQRAQRGQQARADPRVAVGASTQHPASVANPRHAAR